MLNKNGSLWRKAIANILAAVTTALTSAGLVSCGNDEPKPQTETQQQNQQNTQYNNQTNQQPVRSNNDEKDDKDDKDDDKN